MSASFVYDSLGRREKKTINGNLTEFLYDGVNPAQETSGATVLANILAGPGIDEYFSRTDVPVATTSHFFPDALGSAVALTDSAGVVQTEYTYEPFGRTTVTGSSNTNPFQYTGRENDGAGNYYYRARYYHPELHRFVSEDPIEFEGGDINLYTYVGNGPSNSVDPLGLQHWPGSCAAIPCPPPPPKSHAESPKSKSADSAEPERPVCRPRGTNEPWWVEPYFRYFAETGVAVGMLETGDWLMRGGLAAVRTGTPVGVAVGIPVSILGLTISLGGVGVAADAVSGGGMGIIPPPCP